LSLTSHATLEAATCTSDRVVLVKLESQMLLPRTVTQRPKAAEFDFRRLEVLCRHQGEDLLSMHRADLVDTLEIFAA